MDDGVLKYLYHICEYSSSCPPPLREFSFMKGSSPISIRNLELVDLDV